VHDVVDEQQQAPAQRTAGVRAREVFLGEAARLQQRDRKCIPHGQCRRGAGRRGQVQRAGLLLDADMGLMIGSMVMISPVSPEFDRASTTSVLVIMPRSP
jgi:hypothetical protein